MNFRALRTHKKVWYEKNKKKEKENEGFGKKQGDYADCVGDYDYRFIDFGRRKFEFSDGK